MKRAGFGPIVRYRRFLLLWPALRTLMTTNAISTIRTLIADDEPLARKGIRVRLQPEQDISIIGEATDGDEAAETIQALKPDLVFLDVQMPGVDGFQALERAAHVHIPLTIFITAHDSYAIRAFEVHAVDYLLKPVSPARLSAAVCES